jgi:proteasome alpha subunit
MYEEPYRWIEAVGNRRQYLDEQLRQGSPVVALSYADGILLLTLSRGTPKLYEIYDRIGLAGMGHPADLEKLRFSLLEMAHVEGFNRSPSDVTGARLMKYALAPTIKQAFEEIYKAPFIVKILLADLCLRPSRNGQPQDVFLTIDYDGSFDEATGYAVLAATPAIRTEMSAYLKGSPGLASAPLARAFEIALKTWTIGSLAQSSDGSDQEKDDESIKLRTDASPAPIDDAKLVAHLHDAVKERTIECALLERDTPGSSKYRALTASEVAGLVPRMLD